MDTHVIAKVQRSEEQLHRVAPEAFYGPCSVLKLKVNEGQKVLAASEGGQHLRESGGRKKANTDNEGLPDQLDCTT